MTGDMYTHVSVTGNFTRAHNTSFFNLPYHKSVEHKNYLVPWGACNGLMISTCCSFNILVIRWALTLDPPEGQNYVLDIGGSQQKGAGFVFHGGGSQITGGGSETWGGPGSWDPAGSPNLTPEWIYQRVDVLVCPAPATARCASVWMCVQVEEQIWKVLGVRPGDDRLLAWLPTEVLLWV